MTARLVYDASTLAGLISSEVPQAETAIAAEFGPDGFAQLVRVMDGKVWSAKFTARKPTD